VPAETTDTTLTVWPPEIRAPLLAKAELRHFNVDSRSLIIRLAKHSSTWFAVQGADPHHEAAEQLHSDRSLATFGQRMREILSRLFGRLFQFGGRHDNGNQPSHNLAGSLSERSVNFKFDFIEILRILVKSLLPAGQQFKQFSGEPPEHLGNRLDCDTIRTAHFAISHVPASLRNC
jgi:hypothetical protein